MKLIVIYGPPASGKNTIANELCKLTNLKCFPHNLFFQSIKPIFGNATNDDLWDLYENFKLDIIKVAKKKNIDIVLTEIYNEIRSDERFKEFLQELKQVNIHPYFVKIDCSEKELLKRVENNERKGKKLDSKKEYKLIIQKNKLYKNIPFVESLIINSEDLSAKNAAKLIKNKLNLK